MHIETKNININQTTEKQNKNISSSSENKNVFSKLLFSLSGKSLEVNGKVNELLGENVSDGAESGKTLINLEINPFDRQELDVLNQDEKTTQNTKENSVADSVSMYDSVELILLLGEIATSAMNEREKRELISPEDKTKLVDNISIIQSDIKKISELIGGNDFKKVEQDWIQELEEVAFPLLNLMTHIVQTSEIDVKLINLKDDATIDNFVSKINGLISDLEDLGSPKMNFTSMMANLKDNINYIQSLLEKMFEGGPNQTLQLETHQLFSSRKEANEVLNNSKDAQIIGVGQKEFMTGFLDAREKGSTTAPNKGLTGPYLNKETIQEIEQTDLKNTPSTFRQLMQDETLGLSNAGTSKPEELSTLEIDNSISVREQSGGIKVADRDVKIPEMNFSELKQKMSEKIESLQKLFIAKDRILVQINPKNLGVVELYFKKDGNGIQITIELEHKETKQKVEYLMDDLRKEFKEKNIDITFSYKERDGNKGNQEQEQEQRKNEKETLERKEKIESFEEMIKETIGGLKK